ncbi:MAG: hypothetical protein NVS1B1_01570 [Candidatus Limnocylindrales bacterium]
MAPTLSAARSFARPSRWPGKGQDVRARVGTDGTVPWAEPGKPAGDDSTAKYEAERVSDDAYVVSYLGKIGLRAYDPREQRHRQHPEPRIERDVGRRAARHGQWPGANLTEPAITASFPRREHPMGNRALITSLSNRRTR